MKRTLILATMLLVGFALPALGTIINVPADNPTIQGAINASTAGDTVLVAPGTYLENVNFNGHNITLASQFLLSDDPGYISSTIIDGNAAGSVVILENGEGEDTRLIGFTIRNGYAQYGAGINCNGASPEIAHNIIMANEAYDILGGRGGGVFSYYSNMSLHDNIITNNYAEGPLDNCFGGGIYCGYLSPRIYRNIIRNNLGSWGGGGIYCFNATPIINQDVIVGNAGVFGGGLYLDESSPLIINTTISRNEAQWSEGGGIHCENNSNPIIVNTILWEDMAFQDYNEIYIEGGAPVLSYCNVEGGWDGAGNIEEYPYFRDPDNNDYHLMSTEYGYAYDSPCIDVGDPNILDLVLESEWGLGTLLSDMGAYGGGDSAGVAIDDQVRSLPTNAYLLDNYPNPFNASTTIGYGLTFPSAVTISIFDPLGRLVKAFNQGYQAAGDHRLTWNAADQASGFYFYRLQTEKEKITKKMILLK